MESTAAHGMEPRQRPLHWLSFHGIYFCPWNLLLPMEWNPANGHCTGSPSMESTSAHGIYVCPWNGTPPTATALALLPWNLLLPMESTSAHGMEPRQRPLHWLSFH